MLYEVITVTGKHHSGSAQCHQGCYPHSRRHLLFPVRHHQKTDRRITSYNVCYTKLLREGKSIIFCGDVNTAHREIDLARPKANENTSGFLPIERAWIDKVIEHGYIDTFRYVHGDVVESYSWWSYRASYNFV